MADDGRVARQRHKNKQSVERVGDAKLTDAEREAWEFTSQSYKKPENRKDIGGYQYDAEMSDANTAVWHNHTTKKTHVSHRGSKTAYDWLVSDAQIGLGLEDYGSRFQKATRKTAEAHAKYGYNVGSSGHSLGGTATSHVTAQLGNNDWYDGGHTFNAGVSQLGKGGMLSKQRRDCASADPPPYCAKIQHLAEEKDAVSNRNIVCDRFTFGMAPSLCTKTNPFGDTKLFNHTQRRRWYSKLTPPGFLLDSRYATAHGLKNFVADE